MLTPSSVSIVQSLIPPNLLLLTLCTWVAHRCGSLTALTVTFVCIICVYVSMCAYMCVCVCVHVCIRVCMSDNYMCQHFMHTYRMDGQLEFYDAESSEFTPMQSPEHGMATDLEWDPTGRYVVTSVSFWSQKVFLLSIYTYIWLTRWFTNRWILGL